MNAKLAAILSLIAITMRGFAQTPGTQLWDFPANGSIGSAPAIAADGTIYFGTDAQTLYAVTANGVTKWAYPTGGAVRSGPSIGSDGAIYFGAEDGRVYALNPDGTLRWSFAVGGFSDASTALGTNGTVYYAAGDGNLYAISTNGTKLWSFNAGVTHTCSPVVGADGTIYTGSLNDAVYALNTNGVQKWSASLNGIVGGLALGENGTIYVVTGVGDMKLYALGTNGAILWSFQSGGNIFGVPSVGPDGTIYFGSANQKLYAVQANGTEKWEFATGDDVQSTAAIASDGTVYFDSDDGKLYALNSAGSNIWTFNAGSAALSSPVIRPDGSICFGAFNGKLFAVSGSAGPASGQWPMFQRDPQHTGNFGQSLPPRVELVSPTDYAVFQHGAPIPITAAASAFATNVSRVNFYLDAALVGTATNAPFSITLSNATVGSHNLTAQATDALGRTGESSIVQVYVVTRLTVGLTAPTNGAEIFEPQSVVVSAAVTDLDAAVTNVQFFAGTNLIGMTTSPPYSVIWTNLLVGPQVLSASASDTLGGLVVSDPVTVTFYPSNAVIAQNQAYSTSEDTALNVAAPGVLTNDVNRNPTPASAMVITGPLHGTLNLNADGSFLYTPASLFNGSDSFTYEAFSGSVISAPATVQITVTPVGHLPVAQPATNTLAENSQTNIVLRGTDVDGKSLTFLTLTQPIHGYFYSTSQTSNSMSIIYTPTPNYFGPDSFTFAVNDGTVTSLPATVSINITEVPTAPVANNDDYSVVINTPLTVSAGLGVLGNDFDPNGGAIAAYLVSAPSNGTLNLSTNGSFTYTPNAGFVGYDYFTYSVSNLSLGSGSATVSLDVGNERWDDQFGTSGFAEQVNAISVASNGDIYMGGATTRSRGYGGIARWDGRIWNPVGNRALNGVNGTINALAWQGSSLVAGGSFTEAGGRPALALARWDGQAWTNIGGGVNGGIRALAVSGTNLYIGGSFNGAGNQRAANIARWDGTNWFDISGGVNGPVDAIAAATNGDIYVGGEFTTAGNLTVNGFAVCVGGEWNSLGFGSGETVKALVIRDGQLYASGSFTNIGGITASNVARWDGTQWSALGSGLAGGNIDALVFKDGQLYAGQGVTQQGGSTPTEIFKWDGTNWSALPQGLVAQNYSGVFALAATENKLLAGGVFTKAGSAVVDYIASWDGQNWGALNNGLGGNDVFSVAAQGTNVYLGGDFTSAAGTPVNRIARWDGAHWWPLGSATNNGVNQTVNTIAQSASGGIYVGGGFTQAGGVTANYVAQWNGTNWASLGNGASNGFNGAVNALLVNSSGELFAGGSFTQAGGIAATNIAMWNGQTWSPMATGLKGIVLSLASQGTDLYAGGTFSTASGLTVNNVARWDGSKWNAIGAGIGTSFPQIMVHALATRGSEIFAGCSSSSGTGVTAPFVVRWDGANWTEVASNLTMPGATVSIRALDVVGNDLYAGGIFTMINSLSTASVARWDGTNWFPLGTGIQGNDPIVYALASQGNELLAGGSFNVAGAKPSTLFGRWLLTDVPPVVQIQSPASGTVFTVGTNIDLSVLLSAPGGSITQVAYYTGANLIGASSNPPFSLTWSNVFTGNYTLYAYATDSSGQTTISAPVQITVVPPVGDLPPTVSITSPANNTKFPTGQNISIAATASDSDGSIRQVAFYEDGLLIGVATNAPYSVVWSNSVQNDYTISAVAMDNLGATNTSTIQLTLESPPVVYVDEPLEGQQYTAPTLVILEANANEDVGSIVRVDFYTNGVLFATANQASSPEYSYRWNNAPIGNYSITALAVDSFGFSTLSIPVQFSVVSSNAPPLVSITNPISGATYSAPTNIVITVNTTDSDGIQSVQLYTYTSLLATLTNPPFVFVVRNLTDSTYCLNAKATDNRGGVGVSAQVCVTVTNDPSRMPKYNITDLGAVIGGASGASGINSNGVVVGGVTISPATSRPFIYSNGVVTILPLFPGGVGLGGSGVASAINDSGEVTGNAADGSGYGHAFSYLGTNMVNLGTLGGNQSSGVAINASGEIVGSADDANNALRAFLYSDGKMKNLDSFGGTDSRATSINSVGQIVGYASFPPGVEKGFVYNPGGVTQILGTLGGTVCQPYAINDLGEIAGDSYTADGNTHAFLNIQGFIIDLGTFGGFNSAALGMNGYGEIIGSAQDDHLDTRPFLWHNYVLYDLNKLIPTNSGWVLQSANAINDAGQIVGVGLNGTNQNNRAFLLSLAPDSPQHPQDNQLLAYAGGQFNLNIPISLGLPFILEASTNLVNWIPISTNYDRSGLLNFTDPHAGQNSKRFYRATPLN
ncbi:MAG TPA: Ig-like domain-containing protein [Verrucomicrobiae bacterium]|jgi:probable HAF family extracellular repeat protein